MKFSYDKKADALYIRFATKAVADSDQVADNLILDYDSKGRMVGMEVLDASEKMPREVYKKLLGSRLPLTLELVK